MGFEEIKKMGLTESDWWVCFHGRDKNYLSRIFSERDFSYHNYRDFDPNSMLLGMTEVTKRGGYAIIMGEPESDKVNSNNKKIIHYNKKYKSDFLDVFLAAQAKFFIGNSSGLKGISQSFNIPIGGTNIIGFNYVLQPFNSLIIYKKLFSIKKNRILTFDEIFNIGLFDVKDGSKGFNTKYYKDNQLIPIENTKEEIKGLVDDMFNVVYSKDIDFKLNKAIKNKFFSGHKNIQFAGNIAPSFIKLNNKKLKIILSKDLLL